MNFKDNEFRKKTTLSAAVSLCVVILIMVLWHLSLTGSPLKRFQYMLEDSWVRYGVDVEESSFDTVLIAIDHHSIEEQGPWPWDRSLYVDIINVVQEAGAKVIAIDILFDQPKDSDNVLAQALQSANSSMLAVYAPTRYGWQISKYGLEVEKLQRPSPLLASAAKELGHVILTYDIDGKIRKIPAFVSDENATYTAFPLVIGALWQGLRSKDIVLETNKLKIGNIEIPLEDGGFFHIGYLGGPGVFPRVSATDVINGRIPLDIFKSKIVIIGVTCPGLADIWNTPFASQGGMSGLEVLANAAQSIVDRRVSCYAYWETICLVLLSAFCGALVGFNCSIRLAVALCFVVAFLILALGFLVFIYFSKIIIVTPILLSWCGALVCALVINVVGFQKKVLKQEQVIKKMSKVAADASVDNSREGLCKVLQDITGAKYIIGIFRQKKDDALSSGFVGDINKETKRRVLEIIKDHNDLNTLKAWFLNTSTSWFVLEIKSRLEVLGLFLIPTDNVEGMSHFADMAITKAFSTQAAIIIERQLLLEELQETCKGTLEIVMDALEKKAPGLMEHSRQVADVARGIARSLGLEPEVVGLIYKAGMLHDLGLVGVPDYILVKKSSLTAEERVWIESHPAIGAEMVSQVPQLKKCANIIRHHHERYDGKGYPDGLVGSEISLEAKVLAVAEAFVTELTTKFDSYHQDITLLKSEVLQTIKSNIEIQFDKKVVQALLDIEGDIKCN